MRGRNDGSCEKKEFVGGAGQYLKMGTGAFSSLSGVQFGSTTLSGGDLNAQFNPSISVGKLTGPLPHKSSTMGTDNALTSWQKQGALPHSTKTQESTYRF